MSKIMPRWFPQVTGSVWGAFGAPDPRNLPPAVADLPLIVTKGTDDKAPVVFLISGNGGWWGVGDSLSERFRADGLTTVGWNSLAYFISPRTADSTARDLERAIAAFAPDREIVLVGYSFGADVVATIYGRLQPATRTRVRTIALLGLSRIADYAIGFWKILGNRETTVDAVAAINGPVIQCFRGRDEGPRSACTQLDPQKVEIITTAGGHHFDGEYLTLAERILASLKPRS